MKTKKTKIVCTIGPASWDYSVLKRLAEAGMDVARLNFSHGTHEEKSEQIQNIRKISAELKKPIGVLADFQGPKLRLGEIDGIREIKKGEKINLSLNPEGDELPIQFDLTEHVQKGQRIFLNDGLVELEILGVKNKVIQTKALNSGIISSHKGVNVPDTNLKGSAFTDKDKKDLEFAIKADVDFINLSFIQTPQDLEKPFEILKKADSKIRVIVKIEKKEATEHLEEIIKKVHGVMVARGDLGIEMNPADVPIIQQQMIKLARLYEKPVIVATQMLESMTQNPRPTRAEVSDVANAVMSQVDAVMLSAESASGKYPVEAVELMSDVIKSVESNPETQHYIKIDWDNIESTELIFNAINSSAASIAYRIKAKAIAVGTATGRTARILSAFRPNAQILAMVHDQKIYNQLSIIWGVDPYIVEPVSHFEQFVQKIIDKLESSKLFNKGDQVVVVTGVRAGITGTTDTIKVIQL